MNGIILEEILVCGYFQHLMMQTSGRFILFVKKEYQWEQAH